MSNLTDGQTLPGSNFSTPKWLMDSDFAPILISLAAIVVLLGAVSNILLIISIWRTASLRTSANLIVIFMCAVDLCRITHMVAVNLVTAISGRWQYDRSRTCTYAAFMVEFASKATGFSLCVVSLNRLLMITKNDLYCKIFSIKHTVAILIFIVLASLATSLPVTVKGILIYILYSSQTGSCYAYDANPRKPFQISSIFFAIILPSLVMIPSYTWIVFFVRRSRRRVAVRINLLRAPSASVKEELRSAFVIFLTYITYCLFYVPLYVSYLAFLGGIQVPFEVLVVSSLLTDFHRFIRPNLYLLFGTSYRKAIVNLCRSTSSQTTTITSVQLQQQLQRGQQQQHERTNYNDTTAT